MQESTAAFNSYSFKIKLGDLMKNNLNQSMARSCWFEGALAGCSAALSNIDQSLKKKNSPAGTILHLLERLFGNFCKITREKVSDW